MQADSGFTVGHYLEYNAILGKGGREDYQAGRLLKFDTLRFCCRVKYPKFCQIK